MSVHILRCPNCGAELDVTDGAESIRCSYCGARCHVEGQGSTRHLSLITQQLGRIESHAERTAAEIEAMRLQQVHGLASQLHTDEALRRAAAAQEAAAQEVMHATRMQAASLAAQHQAHQNWAAQEAAQYREALKGRSRFRVWSALSYLFLACFFFPPILAILRLTGANEPFSTLVGTAIIAGVVFLPLSAIAAFVASSGARKHNALAPHLGLLPIGSKRAGGRGSQGCMIVFAIVLVEGVIAVPIAQRMPRHDATTQPKANEVHTDSPTNAPSGNAEPVGPSNEHPGGNTNATGDGGRVEPASNARTAANAPAGNIAPPANGDEPADNAHHSD